MNTIKQRWWLLWICSVKMDIQKTESPVSPKKTIAVFSKKWAYIFGSVRGRSRSNGTKKIIEIFIKGRMRKNHKVICSWIFQA